MIIGLQVFISWKTFELPPLVVLVIGQPFSEREIPSLRLSPANEDWLKFVALRQCGPHT